MVDVVSVGLKKSFKRFAPHGSHVVRCGSFTIKIW